MSQLSPATQEIRVTLTLEASTSLNKPEIQNRIAKLDLGHALDLLKVHVQEEADIYGNDPDLALAIDDLENSFPELKICALAIHLEVNPESIQKLNSSAFGQAIYGNQDHEFLVLSDEEADAATDACLDDWIDNEIDAPISEALCSYHCFDAEAWKEDALIAGRGHFLASYDGDEHEQGNYFIYRLC